MEFAEEKRAVKPLSCHVGLLRWLKISVMGPGDSMGQQRRQPLLSPCKEKGKETMDQKLCMHSWVLGQEHGGAARTQQAAEHAMCHSRQDQSRILWDMAEQVCMPGQAGNTRARLLGR